MSTKETSKNPQRTALEPTMASLATLLPESWVNDLVIHTISRRLTSARVGVVDSLVFCANRSTRLRLRLGQVVFKDEVLIFLHEPGHWIFFRWLRASGVLEEYDSMRPASANPPGAEKVKAFLRWACDEDDMAIKLRQVKCPQQRNGSDCGIFALCFARRLLDGDEELDDIIDAEAERKYFAQCLFTSRNLSLKPSELRKIGLAVPCDRKLRARQVLYFIRRRRSYHELLRDGSAGSASTEHIGRAAAADSDSVQQAGLAAVISSLHEGHVTSLASALQTATMVAAAAAEGEHERDLRDKLQQFLNALGKDKDPLVKASSSSLHDQVLRGSLVALRENASIALSMWEARSHQPKVDAEALKRSLYDEYAMCCAFLVALEYAVCKFRRAGTQKRTETVAA
ncbi:ulp1 protease family protein [Colletotrichum tofieldiae]|nr:ulp1 protease family protein [Colletotrichum tofieldiae]